jgi:hypothetical protein
LPGLGVDARFAVNGCDGPACLVWQVVASRDVALVVKLQYEVVQGVRRDQPLGSDLDLIDLATGVQRSIRHSPVTLLARSIAGSLMTFDEITSKPECCQQTWRSYEGDWRTGAVRLLEETTLTACPTGECWRPIPTPITNGAQTIWLRRTGTRNELVLSDRGARGSVIYTTSNGFTFDLDQAGRAAIATFKDSAGEAEVLVYDGGRVRQVTKRAAVPGGDEGFGSVSFSAGKLVWSVGLMPGTVRQVDVVDLATSAATRVTASVEGCGYGGATQRHAAFLCPGRSSRLYDVATATMRDFAPASVLQAYPSALVWREPDAPGINTRVWIVTPVTP